MAKTKYFVYYEKTTAEKINIECSNGAPEAIAMAKRKIANKHGMNFISINNFSAYALNAEDLEEEHFDLDE